MTSENAAPSCAILTEPAIGVSQRVRRGKKEVNSSLSIRFEDTIMMQKNLIERLKAQESITKGTNPYMYYLFIKRSSTEQWG